MADYLDWRDLLDEEEATAAARPASPPHPNVDAAAPADDPASKPALPADIQALLAEKARLEDELRALSGQAKPGAGPDDARRERCFPVKVHSKESRIEERRLRRHDEQLRLLAQRAAERASAARAAQQRREAEAAERRRQWLQARIVALAAAEATARAAAEASLRAAAEAARSHRWAERSRVAVAAKQAERSHANAWSEARHVSQQAAATSRALAREHEQAREAALAEQARAQRALAAAQLVQERRREARVIERHLDERSRRH